MIILEIHSLTKRFSSFWPWNTKIVMLEGANQIWSLHRNWPTLNLLTHHLMSDQNQRISEVRNKNQGDNHSNIDEKEVTKMGSTMEETYHPSTIYWKKVMIYQNILYVEVTHALLWLVAIYAWAFIDWSSNNGMLCPFLNCPWVQHGFWDLLLKRIYKKIILSFELSIK